MSYTNTHRIFTSQLASKASLFNAMWMYLWYTMFYVILNMPTKNYCYPEIFFNDAR